MLNPENVDINHRILTRLADFQHPADADAIVELINRYAQDLMGGKKPLPEDVRLRMIDGLIQVPGAFVVLASMGEHTVGCAACFMGYSTFKAMPLVNIYDLCVDAKWRNRGVGRALIEAVTLEAKLRGCCKVTLEVRVDNPAIRLYERCGFTPGDVSMWFLFKDL